MRKDGRMGEYAEMMLDGTCCATCGEYIGRGARGFPGYCSRQCAIDGGSDQSQVIGKARFPEHKPDVVTCPYCKRLLQGETGLQMHIAAKRKNGDPAHQKPTP